MECLAENLYDLPDPVPACISEVVCEGDPGNFLIESQRLHKIDESYKIPQQHPSIRTDSNKIDAQHFFKS